ncbi:MAG: ATP-binding protein [Synechococcus sp. Tobar2m-G35]|nr:ATP-binding protein [Synechococcus sp. Tobar2m-G35]
MLPRPDRLAALGAALARSPVVALLGPRQCGKTTLARQLVPVQSANYFDLEDPISLARLDEPLTALGELRGTVVIDEVQRRPELFALLRVLADRDDHPARFLILGSASPALLRQSSESLAGRVEIVEMEGFSLAEVGLDSTSALWLRGGFPRSFLAGSDNDSLIWRRDFIRTLLESDLPQLGVRVPAATLQRFWAMLAHFHGQIWNGAELARSLGVNQTTCRRYLDLLAGVFMVRLLQPLHANLLKRQVKAPKLYFRDTGLLHQLLQIADHDALLRHPRLAARGRLVLGYPRWCRARPACAAARPAHRRGDQAVGRPSSDGFDAPGVGRSGAGSVAVDHSGTTRLPARWAHAGDVAGGGIGAGDDGPGPGALRTR